MITEHQEQAMLITWARHTESHWPELAPFQEVNT